MIRATLDVNVLASGFPAGAGTPAALIDLWTDLAYTLVLSEHILDGLARTWQKPYSQRRYRLDQVEQTLALLRSEATLVVPVTTVRGVAADLEDDLVLATAIAGDGHRWRRRLSRDRRSLPASTRPVRKHRHPLPAAVPRAAYRRTR